MANEVVLRPTVRGYQRMLQFICEQANMKTTRGRADREWALNELMNLTAIIPSGEWDSDTVINHPNFGPDNR